MIILTADYENWLREADSIGEDVFSFNKQVTITFSSLTFY